MKPVSPPKDADTRAREGKAKQGPLVQAYDPAGVEYRAKRDEEAPDDVMTMKRERDLAVPHAVPHQRTVDHAGCGEAEEEKREPRAQPLSLAMFGQACRRADRHKQAEQIRGGVDAIV